MRSKLNFSLGAIGLWLCFIASLSILHNASAQQSNQASVQSMLPATDDGEAQWVHYQVAMEPNNGMPCCWRKNNQAICDLERRSNGWGMIGGSTNADGSIPLNSKTLNLYFKLEGQTPVDLFLAGSECPVDAGSQKVHELEAITNSQSLVFLNSLISSSSKSVAHNALAGIALHQGQEAHESLLALAESDTSKLQHQAVFWLGEARNRAGFDSLMRILEDSEHDIDTRSKAVFALSVNSEPQVVDKLIELSQSAPAEKLQSEALFWLAQQFPERAETAISRALENESSQHIKRRAVFALSQLPADRATRALIRVIQSSDDKRVRKEALFWLGQSEDEQALAFLEEVLTAR